MQRIVVAVLALCMFLGTASAQKSEGYLKCKIDPGRAGVFVDGKYLGPAANFKVARKYAIPAGDHDLKIVDPRYEEVARKITITAGKETVVSEKLKLAPLAKPPFGILRTVGFEKYTPIFINDKFYGHADEFSNFAQGLLLPPGTYTVKIVPASGAPKEEKVTIEANKTSIVKK